MAHALKLDDAECSHLFLLAHRRPPPPEAHQKSTITDRIQQLLDDLPRPAYVQNLRWDVVAWNAAADDLFRFAEMPVPDRNLLRMAFVDSATRRRLPAWHEDAPRLLAQFRYDMAVAPDDPAMLALVDDLKALTPGLRRDWEAAGKHVARRGIATMLDRSGQLHRFEHETLVVDEHRHLKMVVYFVAPS